MPSLIWITSEGTITFQMWNKAQWKLSLTATLIPCWLFSHLSFGESHYLVRDVYYSPSPPPLPPPPSWPSTRGFPPKGPWFLPGKMALSLQLLLVLSDQGPDCNRGRINRVKLIDPCSGLVLEGALGMDSLNLDWTWCLRAVDSAESHTNKRTFGSVPYPPTRTQKKAEGCQGMPTQQSDSNTLLPLEKHFYSRSPLFHLTALSKLEIIIRYFCFSFYVKGKFGNFIMQS